MLLYDSDHNAIRIVCSPREQENIIIEEALLKKNLINNKIDWNLFYKYLNINTIEVLEDRNLSNEEVDEYLNKLDDNILKAIHHSTPTASRTDSVNKYINKKIKKLYKKKSQLVTQLFEARHRNEHQRAKLNKKEINHLKRRIKEKITN